MPPVPSSRLRLRRDTAERWASINPILGEGEPAVELGTGRMKVGDGITRWNDLLGFIPQGGDASNATLPEHVLSEDPHPVYDDGRSFALLYENAKV